MFSDFVSILLVEIAIFMSCLPCIGSTKSIDNYFGRGQKSECLSSGLLALHRKQNIRKMKMITYATNWMVIEISFLAVCAGCKSEDS